MNCESAMESALVEQMLAAKKQLAGANSPEKPDAGWPDLE